MKSARCRVFRNFVPFFFVLSAMARPVWSQSAPQSEAVQADTDARIAALNQSLEETRAELTETRAEIRQLRALLEAMNKKMTATTPPAQNTLAQPAAPEAAPAAQSVAPPAQISEDDWQIVKAEVQQQAQEKVESGSKYRLKLWGLALFNAFDVNGSVDDLDVPTAALPRSPGSTSGSLGASLRQSILGITGTGPDLFGARTSADLQFDFFGGLPSGYGGGSSGIVRLKLARIRFDWDHTSIIGGLDTLFFSPEVPTSFMSVAVPAFASSGNLWAWSPSIRVEQRFDMGASEFKVEAGFLAPAAYSTSGYGARLPTPGENSRQPVYAVRFSANGTHGDRPPSIGVSGVYFPQRFPDGATVSGWGSILDWRFPLFPHAELRGEFFAGKGLDSFGGVPVPQLSSPDYSEYLEFGAPALAQVPMMGGWSQLKITVDARSEFNVGVGTGGRDSSELAQDSVFFPTLQYLSPRNQTLFVNYIFRPRSDLLFSPEYRRLRTYPVNGAPAIASQVGIAAGFLF
jgi:uncharacterized coiled-coil protein SlyX